MRARTRRFKAQVLGKLFHVVLPHHAARSQEISLPYQIQIDEILTGYLGEQMHRELFELNQARCRRRCV